MVICTGRVKQRGCQTVWLPCFACCRCCIPPLAAFALALDMLIHCQPVGYDCLSLVAGADKESGDDDEDEEEEGDSTSSEDDKKAREADIKKYDKFWSAFGKAIKMGIIEDASNRWVGM